jgi:hypothetical protein
MPVIEALLNCRGHGPLLQRMAVMSVRNREIKTACASAHIAFL